MEVWRRDDGVEFESEEEAYLDSFDYCADELTDALCDTLNSNKLLDWAMKQEGFWEAFDDEITEARGMLFENYYQNWTEPDLEEEAEIEAMVAEMRKPKTPEVEWVTRYAVDPWGDLYEVNPTK